METIEIFVQGHGISDISIVQGSSDESLGTILKRLGGFDEKDGLLCFVEDTAGVVDLDVLVEELLPLNPQHDFEGPLRLRVSHCRRVEVTVRFNGETVHRRFPPSATVERIHRWATRRAFHLSPQDASEHVLHLQGGSNQPDRDAHIGRLTDGKCCSVAFDLVPCKRVEG